MKNNANVKSLFDREMENPSFRRGYEELSEAFKLEVQFLQAFNRLDLTYDDLARTLHTTKSHISRDLKAGGISDAKMGRIRRMADALGLAFIPVMVPKGKVVSILPKIQKLLAA